MSTLPTLFVSGATGKLGRRVVELLLERGYAGQIIAGSRQPEKLALQGVEARKADFNSAASLDAAFAGVDRLLLISTDALGTEGERQRQHIAAVAAAKRAGVKYIVYTSMPKPDVSAVSFAPDHLGTEEAIIASGIGYTILRHGWYAENLLGALPAVLASGKWYSASGNGPTSYVTREDLARVDAEVLASNFTGNRIVTLTGPELHSVPQIAALASEVLGKPIEVVDVDDAAYASGLAHAGLPASVIPMLASFEINTRQGGMDIQTEAVEILTGQKPQALREFLSANRAALLA